MITDLKNYVSHYKQIMPKELCERAMVELQSAEFEQHKFYNARDNAKRDRSGNKELDVTFTDIPVKKEFMDRLWPILKRYVDELEMPWFNGWQGYSNIRFNKYSETRKMALHADHIQSLFDGERKGIPILSILGVLNVDYEGGDFVLFDDYKIDFKQGDIVIFPSNFLYPHKVEPVTKGTRYSYISWIW